jgi:hypothetical protein
MVKVICNATPLINFARINRLDILNPWGWLKETRFLSIFLFFHQDLSKKPGF